MFVLSYEKLNTLLDNKFPLATQVKARKRKEESDEIGHYYMLASVTATLYKQLKSYKTTKAFLDKLEDMFRGQAALAQHSIIISLINAQQKPDTLVKDHMTTLMGYFTEAANYKANLD
ncbi:hypothetical protein PVK06_008996 [Gossypium arboreum]|uniref:Uncharacterized protein n=1 Tax=Gossypium arboreum TaxID=29729 RepID=A0ABR0QLD4_GOSAR|nr:hypothetical protein PVK06_008996 [Gossypium arboreum]